MSDINDFFKDAPDLLRTGMSQDQMAKLLASMMMIGGMMDGDNGDGKQGEESDHGQTDATQ